MKKPNVARARELRRASTEAEAALWRRLRDRQLNGNKFTRQEPIGPYVGDFVCRRQKLVIELDGGQHAERTDQDSTRTRTLETIGYRVIRFWNNEVLTNIDGVLIAIASALDKPPHPNPLPIGEREVRP